MEKGLSDVSLNDIIERANVAKGALYHYFKNKDDLCQQALKKYVEPFCFTYSTLYENNSKLSLRKKLELFYFDVPNFITDNLNIKENDVLNMRNFCFLLFESVKRFDFMAQSRAKSHSESISFLKKLISEGIEKGEIPNCVEPEKWASTIIILKEGILSLYLLDKDIDINEKLQISFSQIWNEIKSAEINTIINT